MRILFLFGGLPHYYNSIINRLNGNSNLEISVVIPEQKSKSIGAGVYQTEKGIDFEKISLPETKAFYGKPKLNNLTELIENKKPEIIVTIWPYVLMFLFDRKLKRIVNQKNIKLIYKDIPFRIPPYREIFRWDGEKFFDENLRYEASRGLMPFLNRLLLGLVNAVTGKKA